MPKPEMQQSELQKKVWARAEEMNQLVDGHLTLEELHEMRRKVNTELHFIRMREVAAFAEAQKYSFLLQRVSLLINVAEEARRMQDIRAKIAEKEVENAAE